MLIRGSLLKGVDRVSSDLILKSHQVVLNVLDYKMIKYSRYHCSSNSDLIAGIGNKQCGLEIICHGKGIILSKK